MNWISALLLALFSSSLLAMDMTMTQDEELGDEVSYKVLILNGVIQPGDARKLRLLLNDQLRSHRRTVFLVTSPGGVKEEALRMAKEITSHSQKAYRLTGKPDLFAINISCGSACTVLSAAVNKERNLKFLEFFIQSESLFLLHAPTRVLEDGQAWNMSEKSVRQKAFLELLQTYRDSGVNPHWLKGHQALMKRPEGLQLKAKDLCRENTGIIPTSSCSDLSYDDFTALIDEVYEQDLIFSEQLKSRKKKWWWFF